MKSDHHVILRVITKVLIPVIVLYGLYVQFHGDFGPGGGFQAGVILAVAVILYALVFGVPSAMRAVPPARHCRRPDLPPPQVPPTSSGRCDRRDRRSGVDWPWAIAFVDEDRAVAAFLLLGSTPRAPQFFVFLAVA